MGSITMLLIAWFAGRGVITGENQDPLTFLAFIGLFYQILAPAKQLANATSSIQGAAASVKRIFEVLEYDLKIEEIENALPIQNLENKINF